jgi:hypothetical protein
MKKYILVFLVLFCSLFSHDKYVKHWWDLSSSVEESRENHRHHNEDRENHSNYRDDEGRENHSNDRYHNEGRENHSDYRHHDDDRDDDD